MSKKSWYHYGVGDPLSAKSYYKLGILPHYCLCGDKICMIYVENGNNAELDTLSANIQQYIKNGLSTGCPQPQKPYGSKFFVYLRGEL